MSGDPRFPGTIHYTQINETARLHYHKKQTEVYVILEAETDAELQIGDRRQPVRVGDAIVIPPGTPHRGVGRMTVLIICTPDFDPADEYFDSP